MRRRHLLFSTSIGGLDLGRFAVGNLYHCWREQGTDRWLLFCTRDGRGRIGHADGELFTEAGSLVLIAPGTLHDYGVAPGPERWRFLWAHFTAQPGWAPWLSWPEVAPGISHLKPRASVFTAVRTALDEIIDTADCPGQVQEALAVNAMERALILARGALANDRLDPRVTRAIAICRRDFADTLTLSGLAIRAGTSVSRLTALFRSQVGCSVRTYIERLRFDQARNLLTHSSLSVAEIAERAGFRDPFYFSNRFRRTWGQSPSAWREGRR